MTVGYALVAIHAVREGFDYGPRKRIPGLLGHPNETGAYLAMYAPLLLAIALLLFRGNLRVVLLGIVCVAAWGLIASESRGAMTGYGVGILGTFFASRRPLLATSGLVLALVVYILPEVLPERVTGRFESTVVSDNPEYPGKGAADLEDQLEESAANRIIQWKAGLSAMLSNPMGFGFDRFKGVIGDYGGIKGMDAHNIFLLVGVELGVMGLILVIGLFAKIGADAWAVARNATEAFSRAVGMGTFVMVIPAIIVNFFGSRLMQEQPSTYLWVLAGMTARMRDLLASEPLVKEAAMSPSADRVGGFR
jgi:O-antigen ligase